MYKIKGFSLLELMIVMTLLALLAGVAVQTYQQTTQKSLRVDAQTSLLAYHVQLQRCYLNDYDYEPCVKILNLHHPQSSFKDFYSIQALNISNSSYLLQAQAKHTQKQDIDCFIFTINEYQQTLAYTQTGTPNPHCWNL